MNAVLPEGFIIEQGGPLGCLLSRPGWQRAIPFPDEQAAVKYANFLEKLNAAE